MIKNARGYIRKKTTLKEKSFIRDFFDGHNISDTIPVDTCSKKNQDYSFCENKENIPNLVSFSPALFESSHSDNSKKDGSFKDQKNIHAKKIRHPKKINVVKKTKIRKMPKQKQHLNTKNYQSSEPHWPEILSHDLVLQNINNDNCHIFTNKEYMNKASRSTETTTGLSENINKKNIKPSCSSENKAVKYLNIPEFLIQDESINSSGDLFLKPENIVAKKRLKICSRKSGNYVSKTKKYQKITNDSMVLNECKDGNHANDTKTVSERNEISNLYYHKLSIDSSGDLFSSNLKKSKCVQETFQEEHVYLSEKHNLYRTDNELEHNCNFSIQNLQKDILLIKDVSKDDKNSNNVIKKSDVIYSNIAREKENITKNFVYEDKVSGTSNFSPLHVNKDTFLQKFTTSTPVIKNKRSAPFFLDSFETPDHRHKNTYKDFSSYLKDLSNLYKTSLMSFGIKRPSQIKACTISGQRNETRISRDNYASSKTNRSLINILSPSTSLSMTEPKEITKAKLLQLCNQEFVALFSDICNWSILKVKKVGEGTYGEVFRITKGKLSYVLKVIPVSENSDDAFQDLQSVLSEIQISKCLSELRDNKINKTKNFSQVKRASVVYGSYPLKLLDAWDDFKQTKSCYNNRPDIFSDSQLYVILELEYGGIDMSCFVLRNALEAESILKQIAMSLAIAEEEFLFEHRDLHLGNILVERVKRKNISYKLRGKDISFACHGLHVTVIDFTLSHLYKDGFMYYYDLAHDESLFEQSGDYQFDVYKSMRKHLENRWQECSLFSNVLWLKYLCKKLKEFNYSRPSTAAHIKGFKAIETFSCKLMSCKCAFDTLAKCGITPIAFEKPSFHPASKKSIPVARNSSQKSKIGM